MDKKYSCQYCKKAYAQAWTKENHEKACFEYHKKLTLERLKTLSPDAKISIG